MTSVGRLLQMRERERGEYIRNYLTPSVRMKLAHLAAYGVKKHLDKAEEYRVVLSELTKEVGEG